MHTRFISFLFLSLFFSFSVRGQNLMTKNAFIGFYSKTPLEDIRGENNQAYAVLDPASHHLAFAALLKGFLFPKELMQEHFNENYVESDKYPKATFSGTCTGDLQLNKDGIYEVVVKGELNLHGVTKPIETTAQLEVKKDHLIGKATFKIKPEDFNITIPSIVREKIAPEMLVKVEADWTRTN